MAEKKVAGPVGLGQGYDSMTGAGMFTAITTDDWETVDGESKLTYTVCESLDKVMSSLEINESLSVGTLGGLFSVNQKLQFVREQSLTTHSVSIVVYAKKTAGRQMLRRAKLRDDVAAPQTPADFANFVLSYGDSFVVSRTLGGEYMAIYTYFSETQEKKNNLMASMEASGIFKPISVDVSLQAAINKFNSSDKTSYTCKVRVTGIENPSPPSSDKIIEYATTYLSSELTAHVIVNQELYGYEHISGIGTSFNKVRDNIELLSDLKYWGALSRGQNDTQSIHNVHATYGASYGKDEKLQQVHTKLDDLEKALKKANSLFNANPTKPLEMQDIDVDVNWLRDAGVPLLQFETKIVQIARMNMWVSNPVDDIGDDVHAFLLKNKRICTFQMTLANTNYLTFSSLNVTYKDSNGRTKISIHGIPADYASKEMEVPKPSYINNIIATVTRVHNYSINWYLTKLTIDLINGESLQFGEVFLEDGMDVKSIPYPTPANHFVLGFRSSSNINDSLVLEVVYASLYPCVWRSDGIATI